MYTAALLPALLTPVPALHAHPRAYLREFAGFPASIMIRDVALNVAIFVPLGWLLARGSGGGRSSVLLATAIAVTLSFSVETIQYFITTRYSSILDVLANTSGALGGSLLGARPRRTHAWHGRCSQ